MPCIEYKGKKYTYEEFGAMLRDGAFAKMAKSGELNVESLGAEVPSSLLEGARKQIAPQTSSNFANLTTDKDGNYVFFHRGAKGFDEIRPGTGQSGITPSNEAAAIGRVGGVAMYYTKPTDSETMVSGQAQYAVTIAPDEVYDFNEDPENYIVEARQRFEQEHPGKAFDANNQLAYITKIAGENGYKMVVAEWTNGRTRAQTTEALKPTDTQLFEGDVVTKKFDKQYTTNEQKGWSPVVPETKQKKLDALYNKIYKERNKQNRYDDLYRLEEEATKKTQDEITELINNSDISQELKDEYNQILGEKEQTRRSERKAAQDLATEVERIKSVDKATEDGATFNLDGTKYEGVGLVVPAASINTTVEELTPEMITDFVDQQRSKIGDDAVVKVGIYKFKDSNKVSIDLNIIAPESSRDIAIEFARLAGQESLFDLRTFENIKTGADGKNPINFSDKQFKEIAKALKEGKMPNVFGAQETTALDDIFDNTEIQSEVDNALKAMSEIMPELNIVVHDTYESYLDALGESEEAESGGFFDGENTIHINKRAASDTTVAHEVFHAVLKKMLGSERAIQKKALSMVRNLSGQIKSDPQLKAALDEFVGRYTENPETMNEEAVSELFGMLNAGYAELKPVERSAIRKFIDAIAKLLGLGDFLRVKESEYVDLLNTLSQRIRTGEAITAEDVVSLSEQGGKPVVGTFTKKKSLGVKAPSVKDDTRAYLRELVKDINLSLLEGQKFLTNMYDFTSAGDIDLGNGIIIIGFGGKNYVPYIMSLKGKKLNDISNIAAFNSEQNAKDFIRAAQEGNVSLFAPHSGGLESSWQFQQHIFAELIDAILDNDIMSSKELIDRFNTFSTSKEGTKAFRTFSKRYAKEFGNEIKDLSVFEKNPRELVRLLDIDNNFSPDLRKFLQSRIITTNKFKERLGYSNSIQFAERLMDPLNKGVKGGEIMSVIEFDPTTLKIEKTKIDDIDHHPSFGWTVVGKVKNIYQPTEFHQSKDITDSYTFYNTEGVRVSKPSDYLATEYVKEYELAKKGLVKDKKTGKTKKRTGGVFEGTLEDYAEFLFNQSNVSSSAGSIVKVAQFRPSRRKQTPAISKKIEAALNSGATEQEIIDKMTQVGYTEAEAKAYIEQYNNMRSDEYSRVKANIGTITKKVADRAGKNANPKEVRQRQYDDAMNYLQSSLWYENASDTEREMSVRELRSELGFKERTAPVASKVTESKRDTITIDSLQALAQSIRDQNRGAKAALKDLAEKREALRVALKSLVTSGKITNRQASIMLNKAMSVNLNNDNAVDKLIKYIEKVYNNAEIAEKMSKANAMRRVAKKNIRSKIGSAKVAFPILDKLFSIDSREIPLEVLDTYVGIVNQFGKRVGVLSTEKMADVIQKAQDVISAINEEVSKANDLAMIFEMYPDKVLDANGDVLFDKTVKKMKDDGYIDEETAKEMDEYRSDIYKKERATKEEDAQERKDLIKEIVAAKLVTSSRLSDANERKAAREIIQMARNKKMLKALSTQSLRSLAAIMKNIDAGFFPNYGVKLMQAMQIEQQLPDVKNTLENVSLRVISNAYNKLKSLVFRGQTSIELTLESNLATELDFMLGDNKNRHVYNSVIKPLAKAYATFDSEVTSIREKMSEAVEMLERQFSGNTNKVAASKFKIMAYMLQKEFQTNAGQKGVAPAVDFINQTIKAIKGRDTMYTENDIAILEDIKDNYMTDGQIDMNKIMESLSAREKKALGILEAINASMHDKAIFTSGVIRGNRTNMYNNYVPHSVISKRMDNDEKMASVVNAYNNVQAVGTKAGSLQERTPGAKPIMFDPFLVSMNSATDVLLDFHMTIPMQTTSKLLQRTKDELLNDDASDKSIDAVNAVQAIRDRVARFVFTNNKYHDDSILATVGRSYLNTMYRNTLGSVPRFLNELQSNSWYVLTNPANWASGVKYVYKDSDAIGGVQGREIMSLLGSTVVGKLYGKGATGKFADVGLLGSDDVAQGSSSKGSLEVTKDVIARYSIKPLAKFTDYVGDTLVSTPDRLMSIPVWYGSFANEFKRRTGEDIEFSKITDERYRNKYKAALDAATDYADNEVVQAASTVNPFQKAAKLNVDKSKPTYRRFIATVNNYLTNFMITEFNTARAAAYSLVTEGRIPKPKAAAMLTGVYLRVVTYTLMANIITGGFYSLLGFDKDDEEEEELTWDDVVRAAAGGFISMLVSRNFGNIFKIVENYGIEQLNEEYGDMLRQGEEYDPYKHSLVFNKIKEKEITKDPLKTLSVNFAGPYGETVKGVWKINDLIEYENRASGKNKFSEMKKRMSLSGRRKAERMEEMKNDVIFRVGAGSGLIPFAKDIKPIMSGRYKKKGED